MERADALLTELHQMTSLQDKHVDPDEHLQELIAAAARLLRARSCTFLWLTEEHCVPEHQFDSGALDNETVYKRVTVDGEAKLLRNEAADVSPAADDRPCAPIRHGGRVIGMLRVSGPMDKAQFDRDDLRLLHIVTLYIGKSLQIAQLKQLLDSRFAQLALANEVEHTVGQVLATAPNPAGVVKILAKSFYREMTRMGFGSNEIIKAAAEIISQLSRSLRRHTRRQEAAVA
jgi:hypothetical protein